jgi:trehalose 6-phosphate synthase
LEELPEKAPFIWIQDYHFTLLAKMIKEKRPDATIALFWHIPWPTPDTFDICPYQQEILSGMLGCDLIGFHVQNHCNNFLDTANRLTECRVDMEKFSVVKDNRETLIKAFPISIDTKVPQPKDSEINEIRNKLELKDKIVAVGVERIDYTKGITERLRAIDRFLEKYPQYKNKFVFIQLAAPSRTQIPCYQKLTKEIDELTEKINKKYSQGAWKPIIYLKRHFSSEEVYSYYDLAEICIVSSLHDGMNLVAKEYVSAKADQNGVLILSRFTGAARELDDALQINPYSIEELANTIKEAVEMPLDERKQRMTNMQQTISENNIYKWAGSIISELTSLKK